MSSKLYVKTIGTGPDLVLLHGWAIHSGIWQSLLPELTQYFRVTLLDLPGFGRSNLPTTDYNLMHLTQQIVAAVPTPAIWLGWSLGGMITLSAAIHYPEQVTKAILVASSPKFIATTDWPGLSSAVLQQFIENLRLDYQTTLTRFLALQLLKSEHAQELAALIKSALQAPPPSLKGLMHSFNIIRETDLRAELAKINCPSLYIYGRSDALVPIAVSQHIHAWHPSADIAVIRHAGHAPFLSHPKEFLSLVNKHCGYE